jgi:ComF family protein
VWERALDRALEVVFPRRCAGCGAGPWPFCDACRRDLTVLAPPWCERCGRPWPLQVPTCPDCPPPTVTSARAPFAFSGPARRAIHKLKFSGWRGVSTALAGAMVMTGPLPLTDVVTWVPLARRRLAERGYDQARLLAVEAAAQLARPSAGLLRRRISTGPQSRRSGADRRRALQGAFEAGRRPVPRRVLLVDDVLTTGATAAACADALRAAGASEVHLLAAARSFARSAYTRSGPRPGLWLPGDMPR